MTKDPRVYLAHILERADRIETYVSDGEAAFMRDTKTQDVVIRNFEVTGEAAKRVPPRCSCNSGGVVVEGRVTTKLLGCYALPVELTLRKRSAPSARPVDAQSSSCTRAQSWFTSSDSAVSNSARAAAASPCAL